jgi:prepilin-type N-terminal cleavage/methylation domain-containing protein
MKRGFTLVELLVVLSIIAIVFAIVTPVFRYAVESARISSAVSFMHQIGKAIALYRSDWGESGSYATAADAGLPTDLYVHTTWKRLDRKGFESPCGYKPGIGWDNARSAPDYVFYFYSEDVVFPWMARILPKYKENTLMVLDPWCNPSGTEWNNPYAEKRAIGLLLSGQVINRRKAGLADHQDWWAPPPP